MQFILDSRRQLGCDTCFARTIEQHRQRVLDQVTANVELTVFKGEAFQERVHQVKDHRSILSCVRSQVPFQALCSHFVEVFFVPCVFCITFDVPVQAHL